MRIETVSGAVVGETESKWPIATLKPPVRTRDPSDETSLHDPTGWQYDSMVVSTAEKQACAQAFTRYKRANPGFDYRSRCEGECYRFWRIA